jgi:hypothetical protein
MNRLLIVAILAISTVPLYAQGQTANTAKLKTDAQNVVSIISRDKAKTQTYCEIAELSDQIDEEENPAKAEELSQKVNKLEEKLGPEYVALLGGLKDIDPDSHDGRGARTGYAGNERANLCDTYKHRIDKRSIFNRASMTGTNFCETQKKRPSPHKPNR